MHARLRIALLALPLWLPVAQAQPGPVELRVVYEDKDTPDHTGASLLVPDNPGILVEMVGQLPSRVPNLRVSFSRKPWSRCLAELEAGTADAVFASSVNPERMKIGAFPMKDGKEDRHYRIDTKSYSLYKLKDAPIDWDGARFSNVKRSVGAMRGYAIIANLKKMGVPVSEVDRQENAFRMLLAGRLDGFVQLGTEGDYSLKAHPEFKHIVKVAPPVATKDYYLQISHQFQADNPALTLAIWKALAAIRQAESERLTLKYMKAYSD
jgi:polar amino acid transport system substrate-binding protein